MSEPAPHKPPGHPDSGLPATVTLRPIGSPIALGFLALATATVVASGLELGWVDVSESAKVGILVLVFAAPLQLLMSVLGFLGRDASVGAAMGILSATWASIGVIKITSAPGSTSDALGLVLLVAGTSLLIVAIAAATGKLVPALVLAVAGVRFILTGVAQLSGGALEETAGIVGLVVAALALYAALAASLEDVKRRDVLPMLRSGAGQKAVSGDPASQVEHVHHEPGVRTQL